MQHKPDPLPYNTLRTLQMSKNKHKHKKTVKFDQIIGERSSFFDRLTDSKISFALLPISIGFILLVTIFKEEFTGKQLKLITLLLGFLPLGVALAARMYVNEGNVFVSVMILLVFLIFNVFASASLYGHFFY